MANGHVHVNDLGLGFLGAVTDPDGVVRAISPADTLTILFRKPDGSTFARAASVANGPSGLMQYVTVLGDLDQPGLWRVQGSVAQSGTLLYGDVVSFRVFPNIQ